MLYILIFLQESGFSYMCDIGGTILPATRNNDTSLTCNVNMNQVYKYYLCVAS